jgi:hypothetical protein
MVIMDADDTLRLAEDAFHVKTGNRLNGLQIRGKVNRAKSVISPPGLLRKFKLAITV